MMNKKIVLGIGALMVSGALFAGCGANQPQANNSAPAVLSVDHQMIVENHPKMAKAQETMKQEYDKIRTEVEDTQALSMEDRQKKMMEFQNRLQELEKKNLVPIQQEADKIVEDIMKEKGASAVIDKRAVVAGGSDITKEVLQKEGLSAEDAQKVIDGVHGDKEQHLH